jgi:hypothetical protein
MIRALDFLEFIYERGESRLEQYLQGVGIRRFLGEIRPCCGAAPRLRTGAPLPRVRGLSIAQIATRPGRLPATVKAYFYDPTGEKAREVKARYRGICRGCGASTSARNGKADAYAYCKKCHPGAIEREWTRERIREAMHAWDNRYASPPTSHDWSVSHASRRGPEALLRLQDGNWPAASTVSEVYGSWAAGRADAFPDG